MEVCVMYVSISIKVLLLVVALGPVHDFYFRVVLKTWIRSIVAYLTTLDISF